MVGPSSKDGMEEIFQKVFTPEEQAFLKKPGNYKMYFKEDIWEKGQQIIAFGYSEEKLVKTVLK